jgi:hypothetical protein
MTNENELLQKLMISRKIMEKHNEIPRSHSEGQVLTAPMVESHQPVNANYNIPRDIIEGYDTVNGSVTFELFYYVQMYQEVSSIALWNPVSSLIFATSLLPVKTTQTSLPRSIGSNENAFSSVGNNSNMLSAISDFAIAVDGNNQYRPMVIYNPSPEYRLIDMNSYMNLNRVDIIVYWKDTFGNIHPFELSPGNSASVKLMFRRKDFNTTE